MIIIVSVYRPSFILLIGCLVLVERRRKLKITKCIQQLSEILGSSCHCGKEVRSIPVCVLILVTDRPSIRPQTRAETLQRTVDQIKTLQGENEELERKIAKLPEPGW